MQRDIYKELIIWKNSKKRKPLLIQGARQVGKTYTVSHFGKQEYKDFLHLNFEKEPDLSLLFTSNLDPGKLLEEIGFYFNKKIKPNETLIFLDEIQVCEEALTSLKYFYEETPDYHIIAAGSLLGVSVDKDRSFPVGKVNFMNMYPMNFFEFLLAFGEGMLIDRITHQKAIRPLPNILHEKLTYCLKLYLFIGGMPEVLQDYIDNKDILTVRNIQKDILKAYERDFSKHTSKLQAIKNAELWHSVPYQLSKENKKFKYSDVKKKTRAVDYQQTIEWLRQAGLINLAYNISTPKIPLAGYSDLTKFKIYLLDTGLLGAMLDVSSEMIVSPNKLFREYNGAFIENFVAMELICMGVENLFYWTSRGEAEVDFVIQYKNSIYPVEVKSGKSRTLKSLRSYQHNNNPEFIFRCSPRNYFQSNEFVNFPLYAVSTFLQLVQIVK